MVNLNGKRSNRSMGSCVRFVFGLDEFLIGAIGQLE
jgi:hypothetical protein